MVGKYLTDDNEVADYFVVNDKKSDTFHQMVRFNWKKALDKSFHIDLLQDALI